MIFKKGLSFLELIIALSIISVGLVGLIQASNTALELYYRTSRQIIATNLAKSLLAEIISRDFVDPDDPTNTILGPNMGSSQMETRCGSAGNVFDDVDDYNGTSENPPRTVNGTVMNGTAGTPDYSYFTRNATVIYVNFLADNTYDETQPQTPTDYKKITATATVSKVKNISVYGYKTK